MVAVARWLKMLKAGDGVSSSDAKYFSTNRIFADRDFSCHFSAGIPGTSAGHSPSFRCHFDSKRVSHYKYPL